MSVKVMCFHSTPQTLRHTHTHLGKTNTHTLLPTLCYILFQLYSTAFYHGPLKKKCFWRATTLILGIISRMSSFPQLTEGMFREVRAGYRKGLKRRRQPEQNQKHSNGSSRVREHPPPRLQAPRFLSNQAGVSLGEAAGRNSVLFSGYSSNSTCIRGEPGVGAPGRLWLVLFCWG